ncbi:hypothetical protein [Devosia sp. 1566]|uniref:hypothetical protein n=1 Tax=Devosia sp. 1566 TaxID=2499144 RepID=UPI000FDAC1E7|nr:hypothetical protein [Devosia sp. 1566]
MRLDREGRRTVAQFLNGVAVAVVATMLLAPMAGGKVDIGTAVLGAMCALTLHAMALFVAARR